MFQQCQHNSADLGPSHSQVSESQVVVCDTCAIVVHHKFEPVDKEAKIAGVELYHFQDKVLHLFRHVSMIQLDPSFNSRVLATR